MSVLRVFGILLLGTVLGGIFGGAADVFLADMIAGTPFARSHPGTMYVWSGIGIVAAYAGVEVVG